MDTMEINKIVGAVVGALLIYLGVQFFAEMAFQEHHAESYAYSLEIEDESAGEETEVASLTPEEHLAMGDPGRGERIWNACRACHQLEPGAHGTGPALYGVVGREIGHYDDYDYSGALSEQGADVWTEETLFAFLENPGEWAPGTTMSYRGLKPAEDRADLIAYLESVPEE